MADLIQCPKCGLRQTARHAYCSRCEYAFSGSPDEYVRDDASSPTGTPTPPHASMPPHSYGENSTEGRASRRGLGDRETPRTDSVRAVPDGDRLVRDRGSLSRRLSTPASPVPERVDYDYEDELPTAPSWKMPVRQSAAFRVPEEVNDALEEDPTEEQPRVGSRSPDTDTGRDYMVRGRPQGELYASERSLPPQDPLLADLVAGRVSKSPKITDEFALPVDWDQPPVRRSHPGQSVPASRVPRSQPGRRIVAPSGSGRARDGRSRSRSGVRDTLSGLSDSDDRLGRTGTNPGMRPPTHPGSRPATNPRVRPPTHPGVRAPTNPGSRVPRRPMTNPVGDPMPVPSEFDFRGIEDEDFAPPAPPPTPSPGSGARAPGPRRRPMPRTSPGMELPEPASRSWSGREVGGLVAIAVVGVFACLAMVNGLSVYKAKKLLTRTLSEGIGPDGPTADLPGSLQATLAELDVGDQIEATFSNIGGATDTYRIGVELKTPVAGYPMRWKAMREGPFDVEAKIRTLDVFVEEGWVLDPVAHNQLQKYAADREATLRKEREDARELQRKLIVGDGPPPDGQVPPQDESGEAPDGEAPDGGDAPGDGEPPGGAEAPGDGEAPGGTEPPPR